MGQAEGLLFGILASHSCTKKCNASEACNYKELVKSKSILLHASQQMHSKAFMIITHCFRPQNVGALAF